MRQPFYAIGEFITRVRQAARSMLVMFYKKFTLKSHHFMLTGHADTVV